MKLKNTSQNYNLSLFTYPSQVNNSYIKQNKYKTFFGFLKPKPFIINIRYSFLSQYNLNPRKGVFNKFILKSKLYKYTVIRNFFLKTIGVYTNLTIKTLTKLYTKSSTFALFRHKIFNYTTPKLIKPKHSKVPSLGCFSDIRQNSLDVHMQSVHNIHTFSTYNWKIIN